MKLLLFSDIHRDLDAARTIVTLSAEADAAVCAGDLAVKREGLQEVVDILSAIQISTILVPGNGESADELEEACANWSSAQVLHGAGASIEGVEFWGIGGGIPETPFPDWSYDFSEEEGGGLLADCPADGVLVSHSPPNGHVDVADGRPRGSIAVRETSERVSPRRVVCGHIHACWRQEATVGPTRIINVGPQGMIVEV